jgi:hypothetical protein
VSRGCCWEDVRSAAMCVARHVDVCIVGQVPPGTWLHAASCMDPDVVSVYLWSRQPVTSMLGCPVLPQLSADSVSPLEHVSPVILLTSRSNRSVECCLLSCVFVRCSSCIVGVGVAVLASASLCDMISVLQHSVTRQYCMPYAACHTGGWGAENTPCGCVYWCASCC